MVLRACTMQRSLKGWHFTQDNSARKLDLSFDRTVLSFTMACSNYFFVLIWSILVYFMYTSGDRFVYICPFLHKTAPKYDNRKAVLFFGFSRVISEANVFGIVPITSCQSVSRWPQDPDTWTIRFPHRYMAQFAACPSYVILQASWLPTDQYS